MGVFLFTKQILSQVKKQAAAYRPEWLIESPDHHLFYYGSFKNKFANLWRSDEIADIEEQQKELLFFAVINAYQEDILLTLLLT